MDDFLKKALTSVPAQNNLIEAAISGLLSKNPEMTKEEAFKIVAAKLEEKKKALGLM